MSHANTRTARLIAALLLLLACARAPAQSTAFTYQGALNAGPQPATGFYDLHFRLFDALTGGTQVGPLLCLNDVVVANGVTTVQLDFGQVFATTQPRFLQIEVRPDNGQDCSNPNGFTTLAPRQQVTGAPFALHAKSAFSLAPPAGVTGNPLSVAADGNLVSDFGLRQLGSLGVGTTSPVEKVDIRSGNGSYLRVDSANGDLHTNGGSDGAFGIFNDANSAGSTAFISQGLPLLFIGNNGFVGVGTNSQVNGHQFQVHTDLPYSGRFEGTHSIGTTFEFRNTSSNATWEYSVSGSLPGLNLAPGSMYIWNQVFTAPAEFVISPGGFVGLSVPQPAFRLDLPNVADATGRGRANAWVTFSSARWKDNVQTIDHALDKLVRLRGVTFDWKPEHGGAHDLGFVAEEVGRVLPELVTWEEDGRWAKGLAYDHITALTVEAIKEQQEQIKRLQSDNAALRNRLDAIERTLATAAAAKPH